MTTLREWKESYINEDCRTITGMHENALFWGCTFEKLNNVVLKDVVLRNSKFITTKVQDALGFTLTVGDCGSFRDVQYSEELFDMLLVMMIMTKGNTTKRRKLMDVVGSNRVGQILKELATVEQS